MNIVQQTIVENLLNQGRIVRWAGTRGVFLPGKGKIKLEGAYPTACRNPACVKELTSDLTKGWIKLTVVTNLPVISEKGIQKPIAVSQPKPVTVTVPVVKKPAQEAKPIARVEQKQDGNIHTRNVEKRTEKIAIETVLPPAKPLFKEDADSIELLRKQETSEVFKDASVADTIGKRAVEVRVDVAGPRSAFSKKDDDKPTMGTIVTAEGAAQESAKKKTRGRRKTKTE